MITSAGALPCDKVILACEQALLFGQAKRASRETRSLAQTGELARRLKSYTRLNQGGFLGKAKKNAL